MEKAGDRTETRDRATEIEGQREPEMGERGLNGKERLEQQPRAPAPGTSSTVMVCNSEFLAEINSLPLKLLLSAYFITVMQKKIKRGDTARCCRESERESSPGRRDGTLLCPAKMEPSSDTHGRWRSELVSGVSQKTLWLSFQEWLPPSSPEWQLQVTGAW